MCKTAITAAIFCISLFVFSCAAPNPRYARMETQHGRACETAKFNQILHHDTPKNTRPAEGMDGQVAEIINKKYQDDFKEKAPSTPVFETDMKMGN